MKKLIAITLITLTSCVSYPELDNEYKLGMIKARWERGACIHKANRLSSYLYKQRKEHEFKVGYRQKSDLSTHSWVETNIGTNRYVLDPEWHRIYKNPKDKYFAF